jgi:hypothetical protein
MTGRPRRELTRGLQQFRSQLFQVLHDSALGPFLACFVATISLPSINQFVIVTEHAITLGSCSRIDDGKQMLADSLCLFEIHTASDHPIKNQRAPVLEPYNFNRERKSIHH